MGRMKEFAMSDALKCIVTLRNEDGTYDEVGMNKRTLVNTCHTERAVIQLARGWAGGKPFRVEFHRPDEFYKAPYKTQEFDQ